MLVSEVEENFPHEFLLSRTFRSPALSRNAIEPRNDRLHDCIDNLEHGEHGEAEQKAQGAADIAQQRDRPVIGALLDLVEREILVENAQFTRALVPRLHGHRFRVRDVNILLTLAPAVRAIVRRPFAVKNEFLDDCRVRPVGVRRRAILQFRHWCKVAH